LFKEPENIGTLINSCINNDRLAQEQLYRSYYKSMMNLCLRYTKDETSAMEVLNIGFYKVFKNILRYDASKASFYTWARTIIVNTCIDKITLKQKDFITHEINEAEEVNIDAEAIQEMKAEAILQLVRSLPPATQAVFNLYIIEGYGHKEIGVLLKISEGTSKWHLSEARKKLQQSLKARHNN